MSYLIVDLETAGIRGDIILAGIYDSKDKEFRLVEDVNRLKSLINNKVINNYTFVFHNAKFDWQVIKQKLGITIPVDKVYDTMVAAHAIRSDKDSYSLDALTGQKTNLLAALHNIGYAVKDLDTFWNSHDVWKDTYSVVKVVGEYCLQDVKATKGLLDQQQKVFKQKKNRDWYEAVRKDMCLFAVLSDMEHVGIGYDVERHEKLVADLKQQYKDLTQELGLILCPESFTHNPDAKEEDERIVAKVKTYKKGVFKRDGIYYGEHCPIRPFNIASTSDIKFVLIQQGIDLSLLPKTKTGNASVGKSILEILPLKGIYAGLAKAKQLASTMTKLDSLAKHVVDGSIHTSFLQTGTITGRLASINPNVQNLPRASSPFGSEFRSLFVPRQGKTMLVMDLDRIEMVVLGHYMAALGDPALANVTHDPASDIHQANADKWGLSRQEAKTIGFSIVYGATWRRFVSIGLCKTKKEAEAMVASVYENWFVFGKLQNMVKQVLLRKGYLTTLGGRRIYYDYNESLPSWQKSRIMRQAFNALIQGGARDILVKILFEIREVLLKFDASLLSTVHDEIIVEVATDKAEELKTALNVVTQNRKDLHSRVNGDWNTGKNWLEAK